MDDLKICPACGGVGIVNLPEPWEGLHGACPDCDATGTADDNPANTPQNPATTEGG